MSNAAAAAWARVLAAYDLITVWGNRQPILTIRQVAAPGGRMGPYLLLLQPCPLPCLLPATPSLLASCRCSGLDHPRPTLALPAPHSCPLAGALVLHQRPLAGRPVLRGCPGDGHHTRLLPLRHPGPPHQVGGAHEVGGIQGIQGIRWGAGGQPNLPSYTYTTSSSASVVVICVCSMFAMDGGITLEPVANHVALSLETSPWDNPAHPYTIAANLAWAVLFGWWVAAQAGRLGMCVVGGVGGTLLTPPNLVHHHWHHTCGCHLPGRCFSTSSQPLFRDQVTLVWFRSIILCCIPLLPCCIPELGAVQGHGGGAPHGGAGAGCDDCGHRHRRDQRQNRLFRHVSES